jgi:hypothetical protein
VTLPGLLGNDNAAPGSTVELVGNPLNGTLMPLVGGGFIYTPAKDYNGPDSFQYRIRNAANEVSNTVIVNLNITAVNDAPSFTKGPDQVDPRGSGTQTVAAWATGISAGPSNENNQKLSFLVSTNNPGLFSVTPSIDPTTGTLTYTPIPQGYGTAVVTVRLRDDGGTEPGVDRSSPQTFSITVNKHLTENRPVSQNEFSQFAAGAGDGGPGTVTLYNGDSSVAASFHPFADGHGVRPTVADVTGDGVADIIAGTGPGVAGTVVVINGANQQIVQAFLPFGAAFTRGVFVAAGDMNGDGTADIIVSPDAGGGPRVVIYDGRTGQTIADFFGIEDTAFFGGVRVATGDLNADGVADLAVSAGNGGAPRIAVYNGISIRAGQRPAHLVGDFFAFSSDLRTGAFVTIGDLNGDFYDDLIIGAGNGGGPRVQVFDGRSLFGTPGGQFVKLADYFADDPSLRKGVRVAMKNFDGDIKGDLVTAVPTKTASSLDVMGDSAIDYDVLTGLLTGIYIG